MMTKGHFKEVHPLGRVPVYHGSRHVSHVGSRTRVSRYLGYRLGLGYWVLRSVRGKSYEYLFLPGVYIRAPRVTHNTNTCTRENTRGCSFSESRKTRRNLTRRQLPGDAAAVSGAGPIRDFLSVKKK